MFLTESELVTLTGVRQKAAQRRWLANNRIPFRVRADGRATVSRQHVERLLGSANVREISTSDDAYEAAE